MITLISIFHKSLTMFKPRAEHQEVKEPRPVEQLGGVSRTHGSMRLLFKPAFK